MIWDIDPTLFSIGNFEIRWYSLLFASGFLIGYFVVQKMFRAEGKPEAYLDFILMVSVIGTIVGARLAHCLFYEPEVYLADPIRILNIREGGLASHGGFFGVMLALLLFCRKHRDLGFFWLCDRMAIPTMLEAAFIRFGNFFNSEIYGQPTDLPWGVIFVKANETIPRHPTQIYEALGYAAISLGLFIYYKGAQRQPLDGRILGIACAVSFLFRAIVEIWKENQVAFEDGMWLNLGQLLSIPFIIFGIYLAMGLHHKSRWFQWGFPAPVPIEAAPTAKKKHKKKR